MVSLSLLVLLIGAAVGVPVDDFRSNFEFLEEGITNLDEPAYRLLDNVQPSDVRVDLDVYLDLATFTGLVTIHVDVS